MGRTAHPGVGTLKSSATHPMREEKPTRTEEKEMLSAENHRRRWLACLTAVVIAFALAIPAQASSTRVPGHQHDRYDSNDNGFPDADVTVTGKYEALYAYDAGGDWYWDLGDGRVQGTVGAVADLDQETLTVCDYQNQYRGTFDDDPFMDSGWIKNNIRCHGYDGNSTFTYVIVHETDPRYAGNPDWAIWGTWEYHVNSQSGEGNLVHRPDRPVTP